MHNEVVKIEGTKVVDTGVEGEGLLRVDSRDYLYGISEGDHPGHTPFLKYGVVTGVNNAEVDIWEYGTTTAAYVFPTSASATGQRLLKMECY